MTGVGFDISVLGERDLERRLLALEPKLQAKVLGRAMRAGLQEVLQAARAAAPRRSGEMARRLRLRKAKVRRKHGLAYYVRTGTRAEMGIPREASGYYPSAIHQGFLHKRSGKHIAARPYLKPEFDSRRDRILGTIRSALRAELDAVGRG